MKITLESGKTLEITKESNDALEEAADEEKPFPQINQRFNYLNECGDICSERFLPDKDSQRRMISIGNCFATGEESDMHRLRLESMAKRRKLKNGEDYHYWRFDHKKASPVCIWTNSQMDFEGLFMGNCHKTKEEAQAWGEKYHDAWMILFDKS